MGCNNTKVENSSAGEANKAAEPPTPQTDSRLPLTTREVFRLQKSWKGIKRKMEETGVEMFIRLFEQNGTVQKLFRNFNGLEAADQLRADETLRQHATIVVETIDNIITDIENVDTFIKTCTSLRKQHLQYRGFAATTFWYAEEPFIEAVRITLDDAFSEQIEEIYRKTFRFILQNLTDTEVPLKEHVPSVIHVTESSNKT